ncbi:MAG TPA: OmpA family protein [Burkholderiales bacterium]
MEKRILAVLLAAFAGSAAAQTYVTSGAAGTVVTNAFGNCWQSGAGPSGSAGCPPAGSGQSTAAAPVAAPRTQVAQSTLTNERAINERRTSTSASAAGRTAAAGNPAPPSPGYVGSGAGVVATNPFGLCWRSGAEWTPAEAAAPCDAVPRASVPPVPVAQAQPEPAPAPAPEPLAAAAPAPAPEPVVIEKITLNTDVLFEFNKADLRPSGRQKLDELAQSAQGANVDKVVLTGHADRIGSEQYNKELSEKRAQAVADYLAQKGVDSSRLEVEGRGKSEPITGNECDKLGPPSNKNAKLIACLQPDRRVEAELLGSRESTASTTATPSSAGATGTSGTSGTSSSGSGSNQ